MNVTFITGSPRSGTTVLGHILSRHPDIAEWYEPYYLWGRYFPNRQNDIWPDCYLTEESKKKIRREYLNYSQMAGKPIVLDKSHSLVFNVNIVQHIFPEAKWIHILRDGRDVTLSINKEWVYRKAIVNKKDFLRLFQVTLNMLKRQPFWRYRFMAIHYELMSIASFNPVRYLNKSKWDGNVGWGLRFENWQSYLQSHSTLQFNAMQWATAVKAALKGWTLLPEENKIEIRYEALLTSPEKILAKLLDFLGIDGNPRFIESLKILNRNNLNKWKHGFSNSELEKIEPILKPLLTQLGYIP